MADSRLSSPMIRGLQRTPELDAIEKASFLRTCAAFGISPEKLETQMLATIRAQLNRALQTLSKAGDKEAVNVFQQSVAYQFDGDDFWDVQREMDEQRRSHIVGLLAKVLSEAEPSSSFISSFAQRVKVPDPKSASKADLEGLLLSVPVVMLYDLEFNAFVRREPRFNYAPCLFVYQPIGSFLAGLADLLLPQVLEFNSTGGIRPASLDSCTRAGHSPAFKTVCKRIFQWILFEAPVVYALPEELVEIRRLSELSHVWTFQHAMIYDGGREFAWYHEFAHLLMGHLEAAPSPDLEREADGLALDILDHTHVPLPRNIVWAYLGILLLLFVLGVHAARPTILRASSHPTVEDRLEFFLAWSEHHGGRSILSDIGRNLVAVCNPTLADGWNFTLDGSFGPGR